MLLGAATPSVTETAAYIIVRDSVFGALLAVAIVALYALVRVLLVLQDKRVLELQNMNKAFEVRETKFESFTSRMSGALGQQQASLDRLTSTETAQTQALQLNTEALRKVESTLDSVNREYARMAAQSLSFRRSLAPPQRSKSDPPDGGRGRI